jgi:hypothetical protein
LPNVTLTERGRAAATQRPSLANYRAVFLKAGIRPRLNVMTGETDVLFPDHPDLDYLSPLQVLGIARDLCIHARLPNGLTDVGNTIAMMAHGDPYHPAEEWVKSVPWDGQPRIQALLDTVVVEPDQAELWNLLGRKFLIQCVEAWCGWRNNDAARQVGYVLTFSGAQGIGKSTWFGKLAPGFTATGKTLDMSSLHGSRDTKVEVLSAGLIEISELDATFRRSDISRLKAFLTQNVDKYRPAYAATTLTRPRACVFGATVNDPKFLVDDTGNRRFWPFSVLEFKRDAMDDIDRQQLFAEAYQAWSRGESHHPTSVEVRAMMAEHAEQFVTEHGYEETLREFFEDSVRYSKFAPKDAVIEQPMNATKVLERLSIHSDWHSRRAVARLGDKIVGKRQELGGAQFGMKGLDENKRFRDSWRIATLTRALTEDEVKKMRHAERAGLTVVGDAT